MINETNDLDEKVSEQVAFTAKDIPIGFELGRKLGNHFLQNNSNVEPVISIRP